MKQSKQHTLFAFAFSLLVLFSTFSLSITQHLCLGDQNETLIIENACCLSDNLPFQKQDCCDITKGDCLQCVESQLTFEGTEDFYETSLNLDLIIAYIYTQLFESLPTQLNPNNTYEIPLLTANIQLLDQVFLI